MRKLDINKKKKQVGVYFPEKELVKIRKKKGPLFLSPFIRKIVLETLGIEPEE